MGFGSLSILYPCSGNLTDIYAANLSLFLADVAAIDLEPLGCADKPTEKHCWLICCEIKILFQLKK
jgi:hypothetical protein